MLVSSKRNLITSVTSLVIPPAPALGPCLRTSRSLLPLAGRWSAPPASGPGRPA